MSTDGQILSGGKSTPVFGVNMETGEILFEKADALKFNCRDKPLMEDGMQTDGVCSPSNPGLSRVKFEADKNCPLPLQLSIRSMGCS